LKSCLGATSHILYGSEMTLLGTIKVKASGVETWGGTSRRLSGSLSGRSLRRTPRCGYSRDFSYKRCAASAFINCPK
jgi:hypothetical protein